jgi:hypothetical protein
LRKNVNLPAISSDLSTERRANTAPRFLISYHKQSRGDNRRAGEFASQSEKLPRRFAIEPPPPPPPPPLSFRHLERASERSIDRSIAEAIVPRNSRSTREPTFIQARAA